MIFQSTPSVWRETRCEILSVDTSGISIHSLRVEGDPTHNCSLSHTLDFNPLPPCGGRPQRMDRHTVHCHAFQSTPSVWRETFWEYWKRGGTSYFNPLPPCGGRHVPTSLATLEKISIHSLRVEGDRRKPCSLYCLLYFNPLPPCGGRRCCPVAIFSTR